MASWSQPVRLFYISNFFRYDRPQAGRYRMFYQFGVEAIGDGDPSIDAEVLDLLRTFYETLGLTQYRLLLNSIGDPVCRPAYIEKLRAYYADKLDRLCGDCRRRYDVNPLRMLDCKNEPCQPFKADAPRIADHLCDACSDHFKTLRRLLDALGIAYTLDPTLVRGLHYYTRTAFEFEPSDAEGQQSAIGGGGRYDGLIEQLGGQHTPGIGFGAGLERIMLNLKRLELGPAPAVGPSAYIAVVDEAAQGPALALARELRGAGVSVVSGAAGRSLRSQMRQANALGARYAVVLGAKEIESATVSLRDLGTSEQAVVTPQEAIVRIRALP
jgi:histidyl-tRNA synthetase